MMLDSVLHLFTEMDWMPLCAIDINTHYHLSPMGCKV